MTRPVLSDRFYRINWRLTIKLAPGSFCSPDGIGPRVPVVVSYKVELAMSRCPEEGYGTCLYPHQSLVWLRFISQSRDVHEHVSVENTLELLGALLPDHLHQYETIEVKSAQSLKRLDGLKVLYPESSVPSFLLWHGTFVRQFSFKELTPKTEGVAQNLDAANPVSIPK
jgi:hypothetical protein